MIFSYNLMKITNFKPLLQITKWLREKKHEEMFLPNIVFKLSMVIKNYNSSLQIARRYLLKDSSIISIISVSH